MLGRALAMEWMPLINFLEAGIWITSNLSKYVGGAIPASAYKQGIGIVAFKQPVIILHTCIIQSDINMPSMSGMVPRRTGKFSC